MWGISIPGEYNKRGPLVWLDNLPHHRLELKQRIRNVENRE